MISLEKACFNFIVDQFGMFQAAFSVSPDETLNRELEFLQRKYAIELISELSKRSNFKDEYLDFLLNIHLKYLDERWFKYSRHRDSIKDIICRLPNLTKIYLPNKCDDEILERVAEFCPQIAEIDASYSSVTDTGLKYLCKNKNGKASCAKLKEISIHSTDVTDEGLIHLIQNIPSLEDINHDRVPVSLYSIHKGDLHNLECVATYNLVTLDLLPHKYFLYYTDLLKICLTLCPRLKSVSCFIMQKKHLDLFNNSNLETLHLRAFTEKGKINIDSLLRNNGSNLGSLYISNFRTSVSHLTAFCPKLWDLCIESSILLTDPHDVQLSFDYLTDCHFMSTTDDSTNYKAICLLLSCSPNLKSLYFSYCELSPETKTCILKCCEKNLLKCIKFLYTRVEMKFVKDIILSSASLKTLDLQGCDYFLRQRKELTEFVKTLSYKPDIYVDKYWINDYDYDENIADLN